MSGTLTAEAQIATNAVHSIPGMSGLESHRMSGTQSKLEATERLFKSSSLGSKPKSIQGKANVPYQNGAYNGARNFSFPPVPIGSKYSSPSKASSSSSLQQRDLGLAPNPNIVEEIGDRHWHVQGRRGRISIRNDKKIVTYLRRQLRKRIQQWYDETDSDEYDEEKHDRMPLNLDSEAYAKRTPSCRHRKKAIFEQYNDVGGRVSKEGTMVKEDTFVMRHPLIDMSPLPTSRVHSSSDSVLDVIDGDIMDNNNTLTQSSALKYTSQNGDNDVVVNGNSLEKGVTFAEREFEIVPEDKRTAPKSSSSMSITSISSGTSSQRQTPVHREGQVPETLPEIHTTKHDSHSSQSSTAQSPPLVDVLKLPKIAGASTEYENVNEDSNIDDEVRQAQERPDTRGSTVDSDEQIVAFTPVPTPYPLPIGRSDTNDYLKLDYPNTVDQIIRGQLNVKCQINKRIIRIYVSSGISDCEPERNAMMEKVYPKLRQHCTERGFELQISDPNWGLKDSIFDDQGHTDLCLQELKRARQVSRGPNFVTFLAQKYGASEIPTCISCEEFNALTNLLQGRRDEYIASHRPPTSEGDVEAPSGDGSLVREKSSDSLKTKEPNVSKTVEAQKTQVRKFRARKAFLRGASKVMRASRVTRAFMVRSIKPNLTRIREGEGGKSKLNQSHDDDVVKEKSDRDYDSEITLLNTWYKLDENTVPPVYRLQLISSQFKDINARDNVRRVTAKQQWGIQHRRLEALFQTYIRDITSDPARIDNCYKSVLEREIEEGILNLEYKPFEEVQWFRRKITDLEMNVGDFNAKEFMDIIPMSSKANKERSDRLHVLSNIKIPDRTSLSNVHEYSVGWHADGIRPETNRGHYLYIEKMARDLGDVLINKVDRAIHDNMAATDAKSKLYDEIAQHVQFVRERSRVFHGRKETMNKIKEYVRMGPRQPLIIHGQSGYGKTSVMAKAAKDAPYMLKYGEPHVVVRLVGITGESLHIRQLLRSMCLQLCYIFHQNSAMIPHDYRGALNDFNGRLAGATEDNPLFIFMDSLDQLSNENDGRGLQWLPKELPEHVYMIVSTLSEDHYDCFSTLKKMFPEGDNFVEIPELPESDAEFILDHLLAHENRAMTTEQHDVITTAFRKCPTPLYLRLAINESKTWRSYSTGKQIWIADSVKKVITAIFSKMESQHGEPFIRRALGYITAARSGVTHSELLDLLSLDDLVMGDVSSHMTVNVRRFPPILLMRLRNDLDWYLTEQSADDTWTYRWSHRKLHEGAVERYLEQKDKAPSYHSALSEYFMGIWANKKKPYPGSESGAFRYVDPQALTYNINTPTGKTKTIFNLRKLNELPHHLINSNQFEKLKLAILLNYEWLLAKLRATSLRTVLDDIHNALVIEPSDKELKLIADSLQLSETALMRNPRELATQLVGRLRDIIVKDKPISPGDPKKYPHMGRFLKQAIKSSIPTFIPSMTCLTPPGDVLNDLLAGHTDVITAITVTADGYIAVTAAKDNCIKIWDLRSGKVTKTIQGTGKQIRAIRLCLNHFYAVTAETGMIRVWNTRTGQCVFKVDDYIDPASITAAGGDLQILVAFYNGSNVMRTWDLENNFQKLQDVQVQEDDGIHKDQSLCISYNSHGDQVLYAFRNGNKAYVRHARKGQLVRTLAASRDSASITAVGVTRDYFVVSCRYQYMKLSEIYHLELFDTKNGSFIRFVKGCTGDRITELMINKSGSHALSLCTSVDTNTSDIAVWNIETEDHKHLGRHAKVSTMGACMDLNYCLTAAKDERALRKWNLSQKINDRDEAGKSKDKGGIAELLPMKDNPRYVIAKNSRNGPMEVWNVVKDKCAGAPIRTERGLTGDHDIVLIRNEQVVILTDRGMSSVSEEPKPVFQTIYSYNLQTKKYTNKLNNVFIVPSQPHEYRLLDNKLLMGLSDTRDHLICWSLETGHVVQRIKTKFKEMERQQRTLGRRDESNLHAISPMKQRATLRRETTAMMTPWERRSETHTARTRRKEGEIDNERKRIEDLRKEKDNAIEQFIMSKDEKILLCSYFSHHLCVFDMKTQTHISTLEMESSMLYLHTAAMTPTGTHMVHANYDDWDKISYVTLWDLKTGQVRKRIKNEPNVFAIAISDDANRVVFGNDKNILKIWDPFQKNSLRKIKGYAGLRLGVGSQMYLIERATQAIVLSGDVSLWDLEKAALLAVYTPDTRIQCMEVVLDGQLIILGLRDSSSVVTLKLKGREIKEVKIPRDIGPELFNETTGDTDDEDSDEDP